MPGLLGVVLAQILNFSPLFFYSSLQVFKPPFCGFDEVLKSCTGDTGDTGDIGDTGEGDTGDIGDTEDIRDAGDIEDTGDTRDIGDTEDIGDAGDIFSIQTAKKADK